jgi:glycosyltransferase involved in cell wall biosynthesis
MSWPAYVFDVAKRARHARCVPALDTVRCPSVAGLVSVVLPVHNGARHLAEALDSVLAQTYPDLELIVVDDGSTDATPAILAAYAARDARIEIVRQANAGLPKALSCGFRRARGEFLTWTSDDNRLRPDCLARLVDCLRRHPRWDMVYANEDLIGEDGSPLRDSHWFWNYQVPPGSEHVALPTDPAELNTVSNNHVGAAFLYRDRVDMLLGDYSPARFGTEDYDYWMRVNLFLTLRHADFPDPVYQYRFHSRSLTSRDAEMGITRGRPALMAFEDFRRDFALAPLALTVRHGAGVRPRAVARHLARWAERVGRVSAEALERPELSLPRLWLPRVHVEVVERVAEAGPPPPRPAWSALLVTGDDVLPDQVDPAWDVCWVARPLASPPRTRMARQGWLAIPDLDALCAALDVRARSDHLARLEAEIAEPPTPAWPISVVVCTYRRPALLDACLASLAGQRFPPDDYEVIVVNNDPVDRATDAEVAALRARYFPDRPARLRLVHCPLPGLSAARNAGISEARGEVVCFIDDDATAAADWLDTLWAAYREHPEAGVVGGTVRLEVPNPTPAAVRPGRKHYWSEYLPRRSEVHAVDFRAFPFGANWSARRRTLLAIGGFRSRYGRRGADFGGSEEIVAACLVQAIGQQVLVAPAADVLHSPARSRFTRRHVWRTGMRAIRTWLQEQLDGYLPVQVGLWAIADWTAREARAVVQARGPTHDRLLHAIALVGNARLLRPLLAARLARYRRPFVRTF